MFWILPFVIFFNIFGNQLIMEGDIKGWIEESQKSKKNIRD